MISYKYNIIILLVLVVFTMTSAQEKQDNSKNYLSFYLHKPDQFDCGGTGGKWVYVKNTHKSKMIKCKIKKTWKYYNRFDGWKTLHESKEYTIKPKSSMPLGCNRFNNKEQLFKLEKSEFVSD